MTPESSYIQKFAAELVRLGLVDLAELAELGRLEHGRRMAVLHYLAELTFACQNAMNITLGRAALEKVPKNVLAECWAEMAAPHLATDDEWEYRRMAEFLALQAPELLPKFLHLCAGHADAEIRGIATEGSEIQEWASGYKSLNGSENARVWQLVESSRKP